MSFLNVRDKIDFKLFELVTEQIEEIVIKELICEIWGEVDYFIGRSFDVQYHNLKKKYAAYKFKRSKGVITVIKDNE